MGGSLRKLSDQKRQLILSGMGTHVKRCSVVAVLSDSRADPAAANPPHAFPAQVFIFPCSAGGVLERFSTTPDLFLSFRHPPLSYEGG